MFNIKKNKILVTHNGAFHADDLFATAVLSILHNNRVKIIRTRDKKIIDKGDYVYDVGGQYDGSRLFDHHQKGGAGVRSNGIPYSSFGLIWRAYGEKICGDKEVADFINQKIVQPIDAVDNGLDIVVPKFKNVEPYSAQNIFKAYYPTWKEEAVKIDDVFKKEVNQIVPLLKREIEVARAEIEGQRIIIESYNNREDKRIIILDKPFPRHLIQNILPEYSEPIYFIYPSGHDDSWKVEAVRKDLTTYESRKLFPENWRGLMHKDPELIKLTGVEDVNFCHQSGFFAHTISKEGAIELAQKALIS